MSKFLKLLRSVKLAVLLIVYLTITCILATLVPQDRDPAFYSENFPGVLAWLINLTSFSSFFRSIPLFLIPGGLFCVNLSLCTIHRITTRIRAKSSVRIGPDLIHVGLLFTVICGFFVIFDRQETSINLPVGNSVELPGGYTMKLTDFEFEQYENGRPKDWFSTIDIYKGEALFRHAVVEVNKPLSLGSLSVYQFSYVIQDILALTNSQGQMVTLEKGDGFRRGEDVVVFTGIANENEAIIEEWRNDRMMKRYSLFKGDPFEEYTVKDIRQFKESGLQIVKDNSFWPIIISLLLMSLGLFLTYYQKIGDKII